MAPDPRQERRGLVVSIISASALAGIGVAWGLLSGSQVILLDGVYGLIGIVVSVLLLHASRLAGDDPTLRYPYGKESVTPLVIGVQGFVLLATLAYAAIEATSSILAGGSEVTPGWAIAYGVLTTAGSTAVWLFLARRVGSSDLLEAEVAAWRVAALGGVAIVVGFSVMALLQRSSWDAAAPYVDPTLVLLSCIAFIGAPLRMVRTTIVELLEGAPSDSVQAPVRAALEDVGALHGLGEVELRMTKVGAKLYVEVDAQADPSVTIAEEDAVRRELQVRLDALPYEVWLNLELFPRPPTSPS